MPYGLITLQEEMRVFLKVVDFYSALYPQVKFTREERMLKPREVGAVLYTYAGDEVGPMAAERMHDIEETLHEHPVPGIALKKGRQLILLDGHRRLRMAWKRGLPWKLFVVKPSKAMKFTIEETVMGKIREMY